MKHIEKIDNMTQLMSKGKIVEEVDKEIKNNTSKQGWHFDEYTEGYLDALKNIKTFLDTLETKEVDLSNSIQLTWEDMRELYIIFAEVDTEIELCKCDIQITTIGYYQEVLKRFKAQKGE